MNKKTNEVVTAIRYEKELDVQIFTVQGKSHSWLGKINPFSRLDIHEDESMRYTFGLEFASERDYDSFLEAMHIARSQDVEMSLDFDHDIHISRAK